MAKSIELHSGYRFPIHKRAGRYSAEDFNSIDDIVIPLSRMPRYNGHTHSPYFVSDHVCRAVFLSIDCPSIARYIIQRYFVSTQYFNDFFYEDILGMSEGAINCLAKNIFNFYASFLQELLHHDDPEAILGDLPSPVKQHCEGFQEIEGAIWGGMRLYWGFGKLSMSETPNQKGSVVTSAHDAVKEIDILMLKVEKELYHKKKGEPTLNSQTWGSIIEANPIWLFQQEAIKESCAKYDSDFSNCSVTDVHRAFWDMCDELVIKEEDRKDFFDPSFKMEDLIGYPKFDKFGSSINKMIHDVTQISFAEARDYVGRIKGY